MTDYSDSFINDDLYRQIIIDHYNRPHNHCRLPHASHSLEGENASCGDHIELDLLIENGIIKDVGFGGEGCSIFTASASILTDMIKGKTVSEAAELAKAFKARLSAHTNPKIAQTAEDIDLGELEALDGVRDYPVRIKCALLSWETLLQTIGPEPEEAEDESEI
ncbi:SUF system NifU family Fe-S cluster assembly protein [bacterium]|nr:SUF system NifU family Fe-S cluster assembly protein [bacterium]